MTSDQSLDPAVPSASQPSAPAGAIPAPADPASADSLREILDDLSKSPRIPRATYRVQLGEQVPFAAAQELIPYLDALGVSDFYASPLFKPRTGSTHGYDTVDYNQFNPVLGTEEDFDAFAAALAEYDMGLLLDIVPNHMGVNTENVWWTDVLKQGPSSDYARYFDINWQPPNRAMDDKVLLPILGDQYGRILEAGELELVYWHGDFYMHYYEHQFPITPKSYGRILAQVEELLAEEMEEEDDAWLPLELASIVHSLTFLPAYNQTDPESIEVRRREELIIRRRLLNLFEKSERFRKTLDAALAIINGTPDDPESFDTLDELLSEQPYRLAYWRVATDEINYRRFFDINDMAAIRVENAQVFADMHRLAMRLMAEGKVSGLRIDHPDGLWDPEGYFWRLQAAYMEAASAYRLEASSTDGALNLADEVAVRLYALREDADQEANWPFYVLVEKILSESEPMPPSWACHGTTGYDFMYAVNNLFVYSAHEPEFDDLYAAFTDETTPFHELIDRTKKLVMTQSLTSEIDARSAELALIVDQNRRYRDFTQNSLAFGLSEFIAALDVYRTYIVGPDDVSERDRAYIEQAINQAMHRNPLVPSSVFEFLRDTLLMQNFDEFDPEFRPDLREFVMKFQQITGPVMAKSVEDTAFYIYNRLVSLNEVGGHPNRFGLAVDEFHAYNRNKPYPNTMLSSSTHDTKRSEDVRARINVLSELPDEWRTALDQWQSLAIGAKTDVGGELAPSRNDEYLLYQTMLGAYDPRVDDDESFIARIVGYMHKAINEAKVHSNWVNPNDAYAQAVTDFVTAIWQDADFRTAFDAFHTRVAYFGRFNSLAQQLLKLTSPGVPDIYQGTELWDFSLVDPDNRRPVDFVQRFALLRQLEEEDRADRSALAQRLLDEADSGAIKLYLTYRLLQYRRDHETLFRAGEYLPVAVAGPLADHVCAFARRYEKSAVLVVIPLFTALLSDGAMQPPVGELWRNTTLVLPAGIKGKAENLLTGERLVLAKAGNKGTLPVAQALGDWPVGFFEIT